MEILNFKVIDNYRLIKLFTVGFSYKSSRTISKSKNITLTQVFCAYPLIFNQKWVLRCSFNLLTINEDMDNYIRLFAECSDYFFILALPVLRLFESYKVINFRSVYYKQILLSILSYPIHIYPQKNHLEIL